MNSKYNANRTKLYQRGSRHFKKNPPHSTIDRQLATTNANPTRIAGVSDTGDTGPPPSRRCRREKPSPAPTRRLNDGPAKHPVAAMSGIPPRAMARLADRSPMLLPHARTVDPRRAGGIPERVPRSRRRATSRSANASMYVAATKKP